MGPNKNMGRGNFGKHEIEMGGNGGRGWIDLGEAVWNAPFWGVNFIHKKIKTAKTVDKTSKIPRIHPIPSHLYRKLMILYSLQ